MLGVGRASVHRCGDAPSDAGEYLWVTHLGGTIGDHPHMIQSLGRRLSLIFDRGADDPDATGVSHPGAAVLHPLVDFVAYADDCTLSGRIRLRAERLTDMLNDHEELHLVDVLVQSVAERESIEVREVVIPRDELLLVHATGPRGDQTRRTRTRLTHVAMTVGAYRVRGFLHAAPFIDALAALHRRSPMVPLTDAVIDYRIGDEWLRQRVGTLIVNRSAIDHIVEAPEHDISVIEYVPNELEGRATDLASILAGAAGIPDPTPSG